jgi:translation initiation factor IF-3
LLDYSKFIYERNRREREARRAQKQIDIKEIRLRPKTAEHDMLIKVRQAREFGAKVRVRIRFRGREVTHQEIARDLLAKMAEALADAAIVEQRPAMDAMTMLMVLAPSGKVEKKAIQPEEPTSA